MNIDTNVLNKLLANRIQGGPEVEKDESRHGAWGGQTIKQGRGSLLPVTSVWMELRLSAHDFYLEGKRK